MRKPAKTFKDLIVWQKAHKFVLETYEYTKEFPKYELYGLSSQFRRAAVSIPANIAEGFKKKRTKGHNEILKYLTWFFRGMQILHYSCQRS